jgi:hypothetical protein
MIPAIALRHPDDLSGVFDVLAKPLARVAEKCLRLFADDRAHFRGRGVHLEHTEDLMATLVVFERHRTTVFAPVESCHVVRVRKERRVGVESFLRGGVKDHRHFEIEHVTGFGVLHRGVLWLELVFRG